MILGKILAEEGYQTPGKALAGDDSAPRQDPCRATRQGPHRGRQQGHRQAHVNQASTAIHMQLPAQPAGRAPAWQHAAPRPTHQAPAWRHADLRGGSTTAPPQLPACLHGTARITGRGACRSEEERRRTGRASPPSPVKLGGHLSGALNVSCPVIRAISSQYCTPFHLMYATMAAPFDYKRRPMAYWRRIRLFRTTHSPQLVQELKNSLKYTHQSRTRVLRILAAQTWVNDPRAGY